MEMLDCNLLGGRQRMVHCHVSMLCTQLTAVLNEYEYKQYWGKPYTDDVISDLAFIILVMDVV